MFYPQLALCIIANVSFSVVYNLREEKNTLSRLPLLKCDKESTKKQFDYRLKYSWQNFK